MTTQRELEEVACAEGDVIPAFLRDLIREMAVPTPRELEEVGWADDDVIPAFLHDWIQETAVGKFVFEMVQNKCLTLQDFRVLTESPSVPGDHWRIVARAFGLNPGKDKYQLPVFSVPRAYLPPSFHEQVMKHSKMQLDVYGDRVIYNEHSPARVRFIAKVYLTNIFLFYVFTLSFRGLSMCAPYL